MTRPNQLARTLARFEALPTALRVRVVSLILGRIVPLVGNVADPSPGLGWRGKERKALWERGSPGLILALALIHHLVIDAGIPLRELLEWFASLKSRLVIEFVDRHDPMVQQMLRNRRDVFPDYTEQKFGELLSRRARIVDVVTLPGSTRKLFAAEQH